jgi:hypothetical protein
MLEIVLMRIGWFTILIGTGMMVENYAKKKYSAKCANCKYKNKRK